MIENGAVDLALASTMPSKPILTSTMSVTPFPAQRSTSEDLIRRDALVTSGWSTPTPAQNSLSPPPEPVLSTTGVLFSVVLPNSSATAVAKGNTVEEPTILIWSRASAALVSATDAVSARAAAAAMARGVLVKARPPGVHPDGRGRAPARLPGMARAR